MVTHGNGPQVGLLALQAEAYPEGGVYPLDVLDAETEGMIGYLLAAGARQRARPERTVATLLTQVVVDPDDPAFAAPTQADRPRLRRRDGAALADERGWTMRRDGERLAPRRRLARAAWRSSSCPRSELLVDGGVIVICTGGGGIPVVRAADGGYAGVEAVVDKDLAAALLAEELAPTPCCCSPTSTRSYRLGEPTASGRRRARRRSCGR